MISSREDVNVILQNMRCALDAKNCRGTPRKKNVDTLALLGWVWEDAADELYNLSYSDYVRGPEVDREYPTDSEFWIFKREIQGQIIYIKFKLRDDLLLLVSFHIDNM